MTTTQHSCNGGNGPMFGRRTAGCPRCDELTAGAAPRTLHWVEARKRSEREQAGRAAAIRHHYSSGECARTCNGVCVRFDW